MRILVWLFRAFLFFCLFAFALNNSQEVVVHWFFGQAWRSPLVIVVLLTFGLGCAFGVLAMVPSWWRHKRAAARSLPPADDVPPPSAASVSANDPKIPDGI